ncbi:MAG: VOC family protein [Sphingomonadaceae bacterium]|nr:VOC family protein [Sphingomonadaceae bacterium]
MTGRARILDFNFVLAVPDAMATARWWVEQMGFGGMQDLGGWVFVERERFLIMLGSCPDAIPVSDLGDHQYFGYIRLDDLDAYYAEISDKAVEFIKHPTDEPWGMREFAVRTPDGHRVMFGQEVPR